MSVDCVILAAGLSSRMGKNKMILEIGGKTVIERCMGAFYDSCSNIIVVTGKYHEDICRRLSPYPKVCIAYNKNYRQGMFSSVKVGVSHVASERFFVTPGDYPFLKAETVRHMTNTSESFAAPVYGERQGHPILLDKLFVPDILSSTCLSLRDFLQSTQAKKQEVPVDDIGVITDIDTAEDYIAAAKKH